MANTKVTSRVLANDAVLTANIADDQVTTAKIADDQITSALVADDLALGGNPTTTTQSAGNNTTRIATTAFVTTAVANIVDSAPSALDTLNELAAALGDDANFSTTVTNSIAGKVALSGAGQTIADSGNLTLDVAGEIRLSADDNGEVHFYDGSLHYGSILEDNSNLIIQSIVQDEDILFKGNDGSSVITALTLDMSKAGEATFNNNVIANASGGVATLGANGHVTSKQSLDTATAGGRFIGESNRGHLGEIAIEQTADSTDGGYIRFATAASGTTSSTTHMTLASNGKLGLHSGLADTQLHVKNEGGIEVRLEADSNNSGQEDCFIRFYTDGKTQEGIAGMDNNNSSTLFSGNTENAMVFGTVSNLPVVLATNNTERMQISADGNVGIGTASPDSPLEVEATNAYVHLDGSNHAALFIDRASASYDNNVFFQSGGTTKWRFGQMGADDTLQVRDEVNDNSNVLVLKHGGDVGINIDAPQARFHVNQTTVNEVGVFFYNNTATNAACLRVLQDSAGSSGPALLVRQDGSGNAITVDDGSDGNTVFSVSQNGALSKASGSFKIDHPLEAKKDTHHLVHSFVEAPQADNIYRGTATLSSGTATINLDTVSGMTEGTYVLLNTNTSCFTSNETDWDAVKGSVSGNILTITCQNSSSTATVSWLVIGERHDQHMKDTDWTDNNGKVIVEPLKG